MKNREKIIEDYIMSYNNFDIKGMIKDLDPAIEFENISGGETNMSIRGVEAFSKQAEVAKSYFTKRTQQIKSFNHNGEETEIDIDYSAILAVDLPNGLKKGEALQLFGKSIFTFRDDKIIKLTDIS